VSGINNAAVKLIKILKYLKKLLRMSFFLLNFYFKRQRKYKNDEIEFLYLNIGLRTP